MKSRFLRMSFASLALIAALAACQTTSGSSPVNSIMTEQSGLAPKGDILHSTIDFAVVVGNSTALSGWTVQMVAGGAPQKQWSGDAENLPTRLSWDGRTENGLVAPEGVYTAVLLADYGRAGQLAARSSTFLLDVSPPTGSLTFAPAAFVLDSSGAVSPTTITIKGASALAGMDSWSLDIFDSAGRAFRSFDGKWPGTEVVWDGRSAAREWVGADQSYMAQATLRDAYGNYTRVYATVSTGGLPAVQRAPAEPAPGTFTITPASAGFSPTGLHVLDTMTLGLRYGSPASVGSWMVEILDAASRVQRTFKGDGTKLAATVSWDGKDGTGSLAGEGTYRARLSVDYGSAFSPGTATSIPFILDLTAPTATVTLSDPLFSPVEGASTITLTVDARSPVAQIESWRVEIFDPEAHLFRTFNSEWPERSAVWDGKGITGDFVRSAEDYPVRVEVRDEFGNVGETWSMVPVDILVERTATGFRILSSRIFFKPYTADYQDVRPELAAQNVKRLADLTEKLKKFPDYRISLVGHAVMEYWDDAVLGPREQREVLLPLSESRAEAVKSALVALGLDASRFTATGVGGADQLVPDSDLANRWQNRRVAFFIDQ
jgi:hypothetical protein